MKCHTPSCTSSDSLPSKNSLLECLFLDDPWTVQKLLSQIFVCLSGVVCKCTSTKWSYCNVFIRFGTRCAALSRLILSALLFHCHDCLPRLAYKSKAGLVGRRIWIGGIHYPTWTFSLAAHSKILAWTIEHARCALSSCISLTFIQSRVCQPHDCKSDFLRSL